MMNAIQSLDRKLNPIALTSGAKASMRYVNFELSIVRVILMRSVIKKLYILP